MQLEEIKFLLNFSQINFDRNEEALLREINSMDLCKSASLHRVSKWFMEHK